MQNRSRLAVAVMSLGLVLMPLFAQADGQGNHCPFVGHTTMGHGHMLGSFYGSELSLLERLASAPDMTNEQRAQLRAIADKHRPQVRAISDRIREDRSQLFEQMRADKPDDAKVMALSEAKGKADGEMMILSSKIRAEVTGVLTPEQRQRWMQHRQFGGFEHGHEHNNEPANDAGAAKSN